MKWLIDASFAAAPLILVIVVLRALLLHRLPKKAFLALWAVAVLRLLLPISIPSPASIHRLAAYWPVTTVLTPQALITPQQEVTGVTTPAPSGDTLDSAPPPQTASQPVSDTPTPNYTALLWGIGALACMAAFTGNHLRRMREYGASLPVTCGPAAEWLCAQRFRRQVRILKSDRVAAPLTFGLLRPVMLIPKGMEALATQAQRMALSHEAVHIRRLDILWKWLLAVTVSLHWFNPLCWVLFFLAGRDIEMACDEAVVRSFGEAAKSAYALALLDLADRQRPFAAMDTAFSKNATEERILAIMKIRKKSALAGLLAAMLVLGMATVFATSAPPVSQPDGQNLSDAVDMLAEYAAFGLTYDANTGRFFYEGVPVLSFLDIIQPNGEQPIDGTGALSGLMNYANYADGEVAVRAIRDLGAADENAYAPLTGLQVIPIDSLWIGKTPDASAPPYPDEYYTAEEFGAFVRQEQEALPTLVGTWDWSEARRWFMWSQAMVDEQLDKYAQIQESIENGLQLLKGVVNWRQDKVMITDSGAVGIAMRPTGYGAAMTLISAPTDGVWPQYGAELADADYTPPITGMPLNDGEGYAATIHHTDGSSATIGPLRTKEDLLQQLGGYCRMMLEQGKMTQEEVDQVMREHQ